MTLIKKQLTKTDFKNKIASVKPATVPANYKTVKSVAKAAFLKIKKLIK